MSSRMYPSTSRPEDRIFDMVLARIDKIAQ